MKINENHVAIINHRYPVVLIKDKQNILCIHSEKEEQKTVEFIANQYSKIYPGTIRFQKINDNSQLNIQMGVNFNLQAIDGGVCISWNNHEIFLRTKYQHGFQGSSIIDMPYLNDDNANFNLKNGAFFMAVE